MSIMLILLTFLLPTIAAIVVYNLFQQDLAHAKSEYKLKRGALENLVERHRNAIYLHLIIFVATASFRLAGARNHRLFWRGFSESCQ
jgi:hypothetical protein